jgi:hypothetical protein
MLPTFNKYRTWDRPTGHETHAGADKYGGVHGLFGGIKSVIFILPGLPNAVWRKALAEGRNFDRVLARFAEIGYKCF